MRVNIIFVLFVTLYFLAAYFRVQSNFEIISVGLLLFISEKNRSRITNNLCRLSGIFMLQMWFSTFIVPHLYLPLEIDRKHSIVMKGNTRGFAIKIRCTVGDRVNVTFGYECFSHYLFNRVLVRVELKKNLLLLFFSLINNIRS